MEKVAKWQPIATASASAELELSIYDKGEYHALAFPSRREGSGWRDVRANRFFLLEPSHWLILFFNYLQSERSELLDFKSRGADKWQIVHGWLLSSGRVKRR
jgi:hypothetical protein